jgi:hypothetical protein
MSITLFPSQSTSGSGSNFNSFVIPGTVVTQNVYTDVGFTAGDYVFKTPTGSVGGPNNFTITLNSQSVTLPIAGNNYTSSPNLTVTTSQQLISPQGNVQYTYTGQNVSLGNTVLAETQVAAINGAANTGPASALLTNGNLVFLFLGTGGAANTLHYQITTPDGTPVNNGTVTTTCINNLTANTTSVLANGNNFDVCALNAGGFAVCWTSTSLAQNDVFTATFTATGAISRATTSTGIVTNRVFDYDGFLSYLPRITVNNLDQIFISFITFGKPIQGGTGVYGSYPRGYILPLNSGGTTFLASNLSYPAGKAEYFANTYQVANAYGYSSDWLLTSVQMSISPQSNLIGYYYGFGSNYVNSLSVCGVAKFNGYIIANTIINSNYSTTSELYTLANYFSNNIFTGSGTYSNTSRSYRNKGTDVHKPVVLADGSFLYSYIENTNGQLVMIINPYAVYASGGRGQSLGNTWFTTMSRYLSGETSIYGEFADKVVLANSTPSVYGIVPYYGSAPYTPNTYINQTTANTTNTTISSNVYSSTGGSAIVYYQSASDPAVIETSIITWNGNANNSNIMNFPNNVFYFGSVNTTSNGYTTTLFPLASNTPYNYIYKFINANTATSIVSTVGTKYAFTPSFNGTTVIGYGKTAVNNRPNYTVVSSYALTTGDLINSVPLTQDNSYSLLGVATTTAAADSYGTIIINGPASLSGTYGTSTTAKYFNYNTLNSPNYFGNRGYTINRKVILQGLEQ